MKKMKAMTAMKAAKDETPKAMKVVAKLGSDSDGDDDGGARIMKRPATKADTYLDKYNR